MDEDLIVREIIKSLAFEIEAVNEDNVLRWTTTNGTPLSVKVRVRNTDEPRLIQRGPISIPRIGITAPDRLRLVSSDQTILSFNVYLEDESAKQEEYKRRNIFKIFNIGGCLGTCSDDDAPYLPTSSNQKAIGSKGSSQSDSAILDDKVAQIYGAKNAAAPRTGTKNGIFGKCKPGGCLDPPFDEDRYPYTLPKTDRQEKLELEIRELEDKQQADNPGGSVNLPFAKEKHLNTHPKQDHQRKLVSEHHELEPKKQTDITCTASVVSRRTTQEGSIENKNSAQMKITDEDNSKKVMDIYARNSRENSVASNYSNSLITYHTDTSSSESLYESIPNKRTSVKSYNESQRQTYEYPESYFVPPKDFLRHKEEERRYSKEPSNYQIRASSNAKVNDITEMEEKKPIYQNARGSNDINKKKIKLTLTDLHPNPTYLKSESYILTESKNVVDHIIVPNKTTTVDFNDIIRKQEVEHHKLEELNISLSGNDVSTKEAISEIAIKVCATEGTDKNVLRSGEINKHMNPLTSPLIASNDDVHSAVVKTNVQNCDETSNSYPSKEPSNYQIGPSSKTKVNDMTDTNAIKAEMVEHKHVSPHERESKYINIKNMELTLSEIQPNDIEVSQKVIQDKVTPACLAPDFEKPATDIFEDYKNADDHINVADKTTKSDFTTRFKPKISRSGNVDIANMEAPNGQILDEIPNSYPNRTEHNIRMQNKILPSPGTSDYLGEKVLVPSTNKDEYNEKLILTESQSNVSTVAESPYQDVQNISDKAEQTFAEIDLYKNKITDIYTIQSRDRDTAKNSIQSGVLDSPHAQKENSQYGYKDFNKILGESEDLDHKVSIRDNIPAIPAQKFVVDQQKASKLTQEQNKLNLFDVSKYDKNFEESIDSDDDKTIKFGTLVIPDETVIVKKESLITKEKPNIVNITKSKEIDSHNPESNVQNEKSKREDKNLSPYSESNSENKDFDVSSIHSIDFTRVHRSNDEINNGVDTLGKRGNLNSVIIQKDFLRDSDIQFSPESSEKPTSAIFQKTLFIPKRESDINKDEINKTTPLKRNTFTIIASDTSLQKQDEIEETPEEVANTRLKAVDYNKSFLPSQTHNKTKMLQLISKKPENKIHSGSGVEPIEETTQESETKMHSKINDSKKPIVIDQAYIKSETSDKSNKGSENERNLILTTNQTDILVRTSEYNIDNGIEFVQKTDRISVSTLKSGENIEILNKKYQELENKMYRDTHVESLLTNMPTNPTNTKLAGDRTGVLSDQNHSEVASFGIDNIEIESRMHDVSSENILPKPIPDLYSKNNNYGTSAPSIQTREKTVDLPSKKTEGDKSTLSSENHDKPGNFNKTQDNYMYSQTATSQKSITEYGKDLYSKITSDDKLVPPFPSINNTGLLARHDGSGVDLSKISVYSNITDDGKLAQHMLNCDKDIKNEVMEKKTPPAHTENAPMDTTITLIPQNENDSYLEIIDHDILVSVGPRSDEIELGISYNESKHKNYIDSITSENLQDLMSITDRKSTKSESEDVQDKNLDSLMYNESAVNSVQEPLQGKHAHIVNDDKYIFAGQTETENIDTDSNQNPKQTDNIFSVTTFDKTSTDISSVYNNEAQEQIEFTENIYPEINDRTKSISEKNSPFNGHAGLTSDILSNILENAEVEAKSLMQSKGPESTTERGTDLIKLNTKGKQDDSVDNRLSYIAKEPIISVTSHYIGSAPKLDYYSYKTPKNTLVNTSISTLKVDTDQDANNKAVMETLETVKHMNRPTNIDRDDASFNKESNVSEKHRAYQLFKLPVSTKYSVELNKEDFDTMSSAKITEEEPSVDHRQSIVTKQKDKSPPVHQVITEDRSQIQSAISYLDMSFYSYINNDNQRVVQTYSPPIEQQRRNEATVTVVKTVIRHGNEIRIPVDKENDLTLNIVDRHSKICNRGSNIGSPSRYFHREPHGIDRAKKQDVLSKNLALIYESGLIPLHNVIKDLTEQVNILTTKQEILQERKCSTKRIKSLRVIPIAKRCGCKRI